MGYVTTWMTGAAIVVAVLAACVPGGSTESPAASEVAVSRNTPAPMPAARPEPTCPAAVLDLPEAAPLRACRYWIAPVDLPVRVSFDVAAEGWVSWMGTYKPVTQAGRETWVGVTVVNVTNLVRHGCTDHAAQEPAVGPTVAELATSLAELPPFELVRGPQDVELDGYAGTYVELRVPEIEVEVSGGSARFQGCLGQELKSFIGPPLSQAFYGYHSAGQVDRYWILDVEVGRLVIVGHSLPGDPDEDELEAVLASFEIEVLPGPERRAGARPPSGRPPSG